MPVYAFDPAPLASARLWQTCFLRWTLLLYLTYDMLCEVEASGFYL